MFLGFTPLGVTSVANAKNIQIELEVANMNGLTDQYKVRKILSSVEGVLSVVLNAGEDIVTLVYDDVVASLFDVKTSLAAQGYPATEVKP